MFKKGKKEKIFTFLLLISYLFIVLIAFRKVLFSEGMLGLHDDWSIPPFPTQYISLIDGNKYSWSTTYLGSIEFRSLGDYLTIFLGALAFLFHLGGEFFSKYFYICFIFLAGSFFYFFARRNLKISQPAAYFSGLIYMLSPLVFNSVVSGYAILLLSYALLPLFFLFYREILAENQLNLKKIILAGILLRIALTHDIFISLAIILIFSYLFFEIIFFAKEWRKKLLNFFQTALVFLITLLLSAPFCLILINNFLQAFSFAKEQIISWNTLIAPNLFKAFSLDGAGYRYFINSIPKALFPWWTLVNFLIVVTIFSPLLIAPKKKIVLYFGFLVLGSLFIFKGINHPFGQINYFLITRLPWAMVLLRNVQYVTVLTALGYAALFGFFLDRVVFQQRLNYRLAVAMFVFILALLIVNAYPYFSGDFSGNVQVYKLDDSYEYLDNKLRQDEQDYRVYWLPPRQPLAYKNSKFAAQDPMVWGAAKPFVGNGAPRLIIKVLAQNFYTGENLNLQNILAFMGIKKIIYRDDFVSRLPDFMGLDFQVYRKYWTNENLKNSLGKIEGIQLEEKIGDSIEVYENNYFLPHFYIPQNLIYFQGELEGLMDVGSLGDYQIRSAIYLDDTGNMELIDHLDEVIIKGVQENKEELNYTIKVPEEGYYQLLIGDFKQPRPNDIWIDFAGEKIYQEEIKVDRDGWWYLPTRYLEKGEHQVFINFQNWRKVPSVLLRMKKEYRSSKSIPQITFTKINPTKYRVKIEGAKEPYTLVFSEGFHQGWKAYISDQQSATSDQQYGEIVASYFDGEIKEGTHKNIFLGRSTFETWGKNPLPEERHLLMNSYANSWYITPEDAGGKENYELIIEFQPQKLFYIGLFISGLTLVGCLGYLGVTAFRRLAFFT